ncbi:MAG: hypothetical protein II852_14140 [Bacteroidales bacterium]|nr:hypothetical protein [Bacteroidales bacterium]
MDYDFSHDSDGHDTIRKQKIILITMIIMIVSTPFEIMLMKYFVINDGERTIAWHFFYCVVQFLVLFVINFTALEQPQYPDKRDRLDAVLSLIVAAIIIVFKVWFVNYRVNSFEEQALSNSNDTIGIITQKDLTQGKHGERSYYLWAGKNDSLSRRHKVSEDLFNRINPGDTVILQVSKEYPRINKVLIWDPREDEIAKYKRSKK